MALPFVAHSAAEYYRWVVRSQARPDGWRFAKRVSAPVEVPVLQVHGEDDPVVLPEIMPGSRQYCAGPYEEHEVARAGHFLPEEAPEAVSRHLRAWLEHLPA